MANNIANDIMTNNSMARDFVRRLEPGVRQKLLQAKTANNAEAVAQITREYLIGKTLFNYNKFSSAEIARELGNVLSPFLKWPTAIYGDIAENYERYGVKQGSLEFTKKYLAPFFGLLTLHQLMLAAAGEDEETKNQLAGIFGKAGLPGSAPIGSLGALVSGDLLQPPVIQIPFDIITSVANMDPEKALKALSKTADAFLPGAGLIRMIGTDIPRLMGEEESGNTTFERLGLMDEYREAVE